MTVDQRGVPKWSLDGDESVAGLLDAGGSRAVARSRQERPPGCVILVAHSVTMDRRWMQGGSVADPVGGPKRGMTRAGGLIPLIFGLGGVVGGGALFEFVSAEELVRRLFPLLAVFGRVAAAFG